ncbi:ankyrin repeat domain-containing protein [Wolbachia endosymbiont of Atemnus politus]|nr:ankyrin repeat domain-containing protein [Wolbachia endosymbiont of Atemnus politus]
MPLNWAFGNGHIEVVKLLLEHGANFEEKDKNELTPLHWATGRAI